MPKSSSSTPETQVMPEPALEKRARRVYTVEYKMKMIAKTDACKHGELGVLLRKEKLYSHQITAWKRKLASGGIAELQKTAPGPKASNKPEQRHIKQLEKTNTRLLRELEIANWCLDLQKKALSILDH